MLYSTFPRTRPIAGGSARDERNLSTYLAPRAKTVFPSRPRWRQRRAPTTRTASIWTIFREFGARTDQGRHNSPRGRGRQALQFYEGTQLNLLSVRAKGLFAQLAWLLHSFWSAHERCGYRLPRRARGSG